MPIKGAYSGCNWCGGSGCNQCAIEAQKAFEARLKPIGEFDTTTEEGIKAANRAIGAGALEHAFGPDGGGVREIEANCLIEELKKAMRLSFERGNDA